VLLFYRLTRKLNSIILTGKNKEEAMKVTTKGQVTIPQEIREKMGIQPGAEVEFEVKGDVLRMKMVRRAQTRGREIIEHLRGRATVKMTTDEIMALTRGR